MFNPSTGNVNTNPAEAQRFARWFNESYQGNLPAEYVLENGIPNNEYALFQNQMQEKYGGVLGGAAAATAGLLRSTTFGASDFAISALGGQKAREYLNDVKLYNPTISTVAEYAPLLVPVGGAIGAAGKATQAIARFAGSGTSKAASALAAPIMAVNRAGQAAENVILGSAALKGTTQPTVLRKMLAAGGNAAVQGAFFGAGNALSEISLAEQDITKNPEETAWKIASNIGLSALFSGVGGSAFSGVTQGLGAALKTKSLQSTIENVKESISGYKLETRQLLKNKPEVFNEFLASADTEQAIATKLSDSIKTYYQGLQNKLDNIFEKQSKAIEGLPVAGSYGIKVSQIEERINKIINRYTGGDKPIVEEVAKMVGAARSIINRIGGVAIDRMPPRDVVKALDKQIKQLSGSNAIGTNAKLQSIADTLRVIDDLATREPTAARIKKLNTLQKNIIKAIPGVKTIDELIDRADILDQMLVARNNTLTQQVVDPAAAAFLNTKNISISPRQMHNLAKQFKEGADFVADASVVRDVNASMLYTEVYKELLKGLSEIGEKVPEAKALRATNKMLGEMIEAQQDLKRFGFFTREEPDPLKVLRMVTQNENAWEIVGERLARLDKVIGLTGNKSLAQNIQVLRSAQEIFGPKGMSKFFTGRALGALGVGAALGGSTGMFVPDEYKNYLTSIGALGLTVANMPVVRMNLARSVYASMNRFKKQSEALKRAGISADASIPQNILPFLISRQVGAGELALISDYADDRLQRSGNYVLGNEESFVVDATPGDNVSITKDRVSKTKNLNEMFVRRVKEIETLVNAPALRDQVLNENLSEIRTVAPSVADAMQRNALKTLQNIANRIPGAVVQDELTGERNRVASDSEKAAFGRYLKAVDDPFTVLRSLRAGIATKEEVDAIKDNYPALYAQIVYRVRDAADKKGITYKDRLKLRALIGDNAVGGPSVSRLQQNFIEQNQPTSLPNVELSQTKLTNSQRIEAR